jgi:hypothetical protein
MQATVLGPRADQQGAAREQNGDRVIDTGFDLEGGGELRPQLETAKMQQRGDCRRVDRRNNRTD